MTPTDPTPSQRDLDEVFSRVQPYIDTTPKPIRNARLGDTAADFRCELATAIADRFLCQPKEMAWEQRTEELADAVIDFMYAHDTLSRPTDEAGRGWVTDEAVRAAMQEAWDEFCDDARAHPDDIYREDAKTFFRAGKWADMTAANLRATLQRLGQEGEIAESANCSAPMPDRGAVAGALVAYVAAQPDDAQTLPAVQFINNRADLLADAILALISPASTSAAAGDLVERMTSYLDGYAGGHYMAQSCAQAVREVFGQRTGAIPAQVPAEVTAPASPPDIEH